MGAADDEFYEDDEPLEKIIEAFERGEKRVTREPQRGQTAYLMISGLVFKTAVGVTTSSTQSPNKATEELIRS